MSKITSKLQVTIPKALAERYGIQPGDDVRFEDAGEVVRLVPAGAGTSPRGLDSDARLRLFDAATARQRARETGRRLRPAEARGWTREELYRRGPAVSD